MFNPSCKCTCTCTSVRPGSYVSVFISISQGKQFSIWKLSDLFDCEKVVSFFLFNDVHSTHWKTQPGTVIGILNASVLPNNEKVHKSIILLIFPSHYLCRHMENNCIKCMYLQYKGKDNEISITIDNAKKVLIIGRSKDFGLCKSKTKNGRDCSNFINK